MVRPFQIDETGQPIIGEEYERYTGKKRNTTGEVKDIISRSRVDNLRLKKTRSLNWRI
jgi:hypothetical protein